MKNLFVKIITGYREDQHHTIHAEEAHKAYHLFKNPDERGVFDNGVAIIGKNIQAIEPDYHTTMGWNKTHELTPFDYEEISSKGIDRRIRETLYIAKELSKNRPDLIELPLPKAMAIAGLSFEKKSDELETATMQLTKKFNV